MSYLLMLMLVFVLFVFVMSPFFACGSTTSQGPSKPLPQLLMYQEGAHCYHCLETCCASCFCLVHPYAEAEGAKSLVLSLL